MYIYRCEGANRNPVSNTNKKSFEQKAELALEIAAQRPSEQVVVPAQIETNKEKDEYEPVDETKERGGLRFVPTVYTRYENDDEF